MRTESAIAVAFAILAIGAPVPLLNALSDLPSVEWSKSYSDMWANFAIQTTDGGYAIVGYSGSQTASIMLNPPFQRPINESLYISLVTNHTAVLVKTNSVGGVQWRKSYGAEVFGSNREIVSVIQTTDNGYMLIGEGGYLAKTDGKGDIQWSRKLESGSTATALVDVEAGIQTSDGNYVIVGNTLTENGNIAWLLKVDEQSAILWNKTFTGGFSVRTVIETNDRGCVLAGSWRNDFWLAKIDFNSNLQWSQTFAYGEPSDVHYVSSVAKTRDGGYVLAGTGTWQANGGLNVPWLIKVNSQGHEQWSLPYGHISPDGFSSVVQTEDEGYMVALNNTAVLVRTDPSGSEQWNITYADPRAILPALSVFPVYRTACLIKTQGGGYAVMGTASGGTVWLTKISHEPDFTPPAITVLSPENKLYDTDEIQLIFTVNEPTTWIGYSLDGQSNMTIVANATLHGLSKGAHNLAVYAEDNAGNIGASELVHFTIGSRFPIELVAAIISVIVVVSLVFLFRFKKQQKIHIKKQSITVFLNKRIVRTLITIGFCIMLAYIQIFFPHFYLSTVPRSSNPYFEVGVSYVYEQDNVGQIYDEVLRIHNLGIEVIRVNMVCDSTELNDYLNSMTDVFFAATQQLNMRVALIIQNNADADEIRYYLNRWGRYLTYIQILNEPESASSWDVGALFTDDEAISKFEQVYTIVKAYNLSTQLYTNFGAGFVVRSNLPIRFSEKLDFVGYDVFMESFLVLSPNFIQLLQKITNRDVVITEFGMSTNDDAAQSSYLLRGLNLFKNMGLEGCWLVYWNSANNAYGIRGRLAEKTVGEWIAQNTKTR
ncbi:MAG: hypothetical protein QXU99_06075 [Candidatus Bathyarchaeia archaeon]